jgi:hypothetical protein
MQLLPLLLVRSFRPPSHQRWSSIAAPRQQQPKQQQPKQQQPKQQQQQQQQPVTSVVLCAVGSGSGARPSGARRTSANSVASKYSPTADNLKLRGISAAEAAYDRRWDDPEQCRRAVQHFFETLLECPDREAAGAEEAEADNELLVERRGAGGGGGGRYRRRGETPSAPAATPGS